MRKFLLFLAIAVMAIVTFSANALNGVITSGKSVDIQPGFVGSFYHPRLQMAQYLSSDENIELNLLLITLVHPTEYRKFPSEPHILLKFNDNSISELVGFDEPITDYSSSWNGLFKRYDKFYFTQMKYEIDDETLNKLLTMPIIKVRVELANGDKVDYDIKEKHANKVLKHIQKTWQEVLNKQGERIDNVNGGYKDDF